MAKGLRPTTRAAREATKAKNKAAREAAAGEHAERGDEEFAQDLFTKNDAPVFEYEEIPINGGREFTMYGEKFRIVDLPKADKERYPGKKYGINAWDKESKNWFGTVEDILDPSSPMFFESIKEARKFFNDNSQFVSIEFSKGGEYYQKRLYDPWRKA